VKRSELRTLIARAAQEAECDAEQTARLVATADSADKIAVGTFRIDNPDVKCGCPAFEAGFCSWDDDKCDVVWSEDAGNVEKFPMPFDRSFAYGKGETIQTGDDEYVEIEDD
jgi:hypothetical protein